MAGLGALPTAIGRPVSRGFYAHTDRDPTIPQYAEAERAMGFRPPHAMESALSVTPLLASLLYDRDPTVMLPRQHSPPSVGTMAPLPAPSDRTGWRRTPKRPSQTCWQVHVPDGMGRLVALRSG